MPDPPNLSPEGASSSSPWRRLIAWTLPFLLLVVAATILLPRAAMLRRTVETKPLATTTFPDGSVFDLFRVECTSAFTIHSRRSRPFWTLGGGNGTSTHARLSTEFQIIRTDGVFERTECQLRDSSSNALFLVARLSEPGRGELIPDLAYFGDRDRVEEVRRDSEAVFESFETLSSPSSSWSARPPFLVEVEDGGGGWLPMTGPIAFDGRDGRSLLLAPVFRRRSPRLKLRVTLPDRGASTEIEITNPGHSPAGHPAWVADPEPWEIHTPEATVLVTEIDSLQFSRPKKELPNPKFRVRPLGDLPPNAYQVRLQSIEDETGNRADPFAYRLLPGISVLRFHATIERSRDYPWSPHEVALLAEGTWSAGSSQLSLTRLPETIALGMTEFSLAPDSSPGRNDQWEFTLRGRTAETNLPRQYRLVVFLDGEPRSSRQSRGYGGSASSNGTKTDYEYTVDWPGQITDGQRIRVGLLPETREHEFHVTLPVPPEFLPKP